ncbi:hypothetical protein MRX96_054442 [Rhipicephalus microplus]
MCSGRGPCPETTKTSAAGKARSPRINIAVRVSTQEALSSSARRLRRHHVEDPRKNGRREAVLLYGFVSGCSQHPALPSGAPVFVPSRWLRSFCPVELVRCPMPKTKDQAHPTSERGNPAPVCIRRDATLTFF